MKTVVKAINTTSQLAGVISCLLIVFSVLLTCQMIFIRYFLNGSTVWQTEVVIYLMIAATLLGLPYVQKLRGHVNVDLLPLYLQGKRRKQLEFITQLVTLVLLLMITFYGAELTYTAWAKNWTSETVSAVPLWIPYITIPLGFALFSLQVLADMLAVKLDDQQPLATEVK